MRVSNYLSNIYIEYESGGDIDKTLSFEEYLYKIRSYLKDIISNTKYDNKNTTQGKFN